MEMDHYYYYSDFDKIFRCIRVKNNVRAARERATVRDSEQLKSRFHSLQYETLLLLLLQNLPQHATVQFIRDQSVDDHRIFEIEF